MKHLRVAVVGCGFWSSFQVPAWQELAEVDCIAVCDDLKQFILADVGTQILDVVRFLFGEAKRLTCQIQTILAPDFNLRLTDAEETVARRCLSPKCQWADPDYALVHASIVECHRNLRNGFDGNRSRRDDWR